jgi:membrane protease YdiL (CAAX protease family)
MMWPLAVFFSLGLVAVAISVAPLGWDAFSALRFHPVPRRLYVVGVVGTIVLSFLVSQLGLEPEGMKQAMKASADRSSFMVSFVVLAVLAPLVEELVFRGLLFGWIETRWSGGAAFFASSILFALAHYEPAHIALVLPLAFMFGWLRWYSGSIMPSLVAHMANNGFAVLAAAYLSA